jgi:hypothetical protein
MRPYAGIVSKYSDLLLSPSKQGQAALAFAQEIKLIVPAHRLLFASGELGNTELHSPCVSFGAAHRPQTLVHAAPNDYFLTSGESADLQTVGIRVLAFSEINQVALLSILKPDAALSPKAVRTSG